MAFPTSPVNGQVTTQNGINYIYSSATNSWARTQQTLPTLSVNVDTFISDGSTLVYTLSVTPATKELITVNIDGVLQQKSAYTILTNVLTLTGTPIVGAVIEVKTIMANPTSVLTGLVFDSFTGNGTTTVYSLSTAPTNKNYTIVSVGGVVQQKTTYSTSSNTLTFSVAPPNNAPVEVTTFGPAITSVIAGGSNTQIQINNNGALAGYSNLTFDPTTNTLATGNITATGNLTVTGTIINPALKSVVMGYNIIFGG